MKSKLPLLSNVFVFIVGLLLVVLHNRAAILEMIIIIIGIMFIVPSCLALIALFARKEKRMMSGVAGVPIVGGLILGIALVAAPQFFVGFTAYTLSDLRPIPLLLCLFWGLSTNCGHCCRGAVGCISRLAAILFQH